MSQGQVPSGPPLEILVKGKRYAVGLLRGAPGSQTLGVVISGEIDEESQFDTLFLEIERSGRKSVEFNLSDVTQLNSVGVREWLLFIQKLRGRVSYRFQVLSPVIVEYANQVLNLLGDEPHKVEAFQVSYYCEGCKSRMNVVLKISEMMLPGGTIKAAPRYNCPKCGQVLELDYPEEEYFRFLRRCQAPAGAQA